MKTQIRITLVVLILLFVSCKDAGHEHDHQRMQAGAPADGSLFDLEFGWTTQDNNQFYWKNLTGEPVVISMFYSSCQSVCPRIVTDMQRIAKQIEKKTGKLPKMALVSFDPAVDTPAALKKYSKKMDLGDNWVLLNGSEDAVRMLSVLLGVSYQKTSGNDFNHSTVISLVSKEGRIVARIEGIGADSTPIIEKY
ncbi:MAG: SCO family protein [Leptospira sp.]|nr:SCO family protein [Leptospira sp.]